MMRKWVAEGKDIDLDGRRNGTFLVAPSYTCVCVGGGGVTFSTYVPCPMSFVPPPPPRPPLVQPFFGKFCLKALLSSRKAKYLEYIPIYVCISVLGGRGVLGLADILEKSPVTALVVCQRHLNIHFIYLGTCFTVLYCKGKGKAGPTMVQPQIPEIQPAQPSISMFSCFPKEI